MFDFYLLQGWLLVLVRISAFIVVAPFFSIKGIPAMLKIGFSVALTTILMPFIAFEPFEELALFAWWLLVVKEVAVGLTLGYLASLIFAAVRVAGELIDIQMGFAMASVLDPQTQSRITLVGQFKYMFATLLFLAIDGHHLLISSIAHSFELIPPMRVVMEPAVSLFILKAFVNMFLLSFKLAVPIVAVLVISDISLGLIARTVPQIHVFILGFPLKSGLGILMLILLLPMFSSFMGYLVSQLEADFLTLMELFMP